jgi:cytochrome P450
MGPFWRIWYPKKFTTAMKVLNDFLEPYIERAISRSREDIERKEQHGEKVNFTDSLSQFTRDRTVLRDQLVSTLIAGRDTTACTLSWLFYELSHHPHIYQTLREEVLKTLGTDGKPTYDDLKSMKYMQWCLNEGIPISSTNIVLRLYPIVPFNVRTALTDTTLPHGGGSTGLDVRPVHILIKPIAVPKGTQCGYSVLVMQRRQDLFGSTVDEFNPSRWATWTPVAWTYIPFNGGPRICLGQNFALTEMAYATARMCQVFTGIESRALEKRGTGVFKTDIVLSPLFGVKVGLLVGKAG